jgi:Cu/Ag efflux pump CusA
VAYAPEYRQSLQAIENIIIYNPRGQAIRLSELGKVVERFTPPTIERKNRQRVITVSSTVSGTTLDKAVAGINAELKQINKPADIYVTIAGAFKEQQEGLPTYREFAIQNGVDIISNNLQNGVDNIYRFFDAIVPLSQLGPLTGSLVGGYKRKYKITIKKNKLNNKNKTRKH